MYMPIFDATKILFAGIFTSKDFYDLNLGSGHATYLKELSIK